MEKINYENSMTYIKSLLKKIFYSIIVVCFMTFIIVVNETIDVDSHKPRNKYFQKYELSIFNSEDDVKKYKCDTFVIDQNIFHLYDTNNIETLTIIIPKTKIVEIKKLNYD